jgi:hypothetical protein
MTNDEARMTKEAQRTKVEKPAASSSFVFRFSSFLRHSSFVLRHFPRVQRITRTATSLAIVVVAYWAYVLLAVPWIEPPAVRPPDPGNLQPDQPAAPNLRNEQAKWLKDFFPPGAWELCDPIILESGRAKLLLQKYSVVVEDRRCVDLDHCTIVIPYEGAADSEAQRHRQTVILEAPGGALLRFDQPLDFSHMKVGRLVGGQLRGEVTIRSDWKQPGPEDDLLIKTRDVQLSEQVVSTPNPVDFRWGPHFGRGRDMRIKLLAGAAKPGDPLGGPNVGGIESFELRQVEQLHLDLGQASEKGTGPIGAEHPAGRAGQLDLSPFPTGSVPVDIQCRGPFRFDAVRRVATFQDGVDVKKQNPAGPADQIICELLSLYFIDAPKKKPDSRELTAPGAAPGTAASSSAGSLDLVAERIEARGNPVVVRAPSKDLHAEGPRIEYNLLARSIALDGAQEVFLRQGSNEIHARSLYYKSAGEGRLGQAVAQGPGWLRGQDDRGAHQQLEAVWKDQLLIQPRGQLQEISLTNGTLTFQGLGRLQASEIFFWLTETSVAAPHEKFDVRPTSMMARKNVRLDAAQVTGKVEQMEVWFAERDAGRGAGNEEAGGRGAAESRSVGTAAPVSGLSGQASDGPAAAPAQPSDIGPVEVTGRLLRARVLFSGQQATVSDLSIEDGVQFLETQTSRPDERPLLIRGDRLDAANLSAAGGSLTITGRPARFEGRGLGLTGSNIRLDRGQNRLWIEGAGQMDLPMAADLEGRPLAVPGVLTVDWQGSMNFDGGKASFRDHVVAAAPRLQSQTETMQFRLQTARMDVKLQRPIHFSDPKTEGQPQVEIVQCFGGTAMDNRTFDARRQLIAFEQLQVADLGISPPPSGQLTAGGPGWINIVRLGSNNPLGGNEGAAAGLSGREGATAGLSSRANNTAGQAGSGTLPTDQLHCLHIKFQGPVTGNLMRRQLTFHDQVKTSYAPVNSWDAMLTTDDPDQLGPDGATVRCDQLTVTQMLLPVDGRSAVELEALGNARAENTKFVARGNRITYAEAKDLLILEGNPAELWRQLQSGAPAAKTAFKTIWYWPKTNRLSIGGLQSVDGG